MKKSIEKLIILILCIGLGIIIPVHIRHGENSEIVTIKTINEGKNDVLKLKEEIKDLKNLITERENYLETVSSAVYKDDITKVLKNEIDKYKMISGLKDLQGPGVMISINDNSEDDSLSSNYAYDLVHDMNIMVLLNDLKDAGAEAISIKGQRILSTSETVCGGPVIIINGESITAPFVINAIGDPKRLYAAVTAPNTYGEMFKNVYKLDMRTIMSQNVRVPRTWSNIELKYAKPVEEGE